MSLIDTTNPTEATGAVAELYERLQGHSPYLPNYARVFSHRPEMMAPLGVMLKAVMAPLEPRLWCLVSLAAAHSSGTSYCTLVFANKLISRYFSEDDVAAIVAGAGPLTQAERAAFDFAARVAASPAAVDRSDIDRLRAAGYSDTAIFDLAAAAAWRCFFARLAESLGAVPDRALGQMGDHLLEALLVGRQLESAAEEAVKLQQSCAKSSQALQVSRT